MKERAAELEMEKTRRRGNKKAAEELDLLAKLESMDPADRALAERIHAIVTTAAPDLAPKLWYGQPAYALKGKVVCFFRSGHDDKERYTPPSDSPRTPTSTTADSGRRRSRSAPWTPRPRRPLRRWSRRR